MKVSSTVISMSAQPGGSVTPSAGCQTNTESGLSKESPRRGRVAATEDQSLGGKLYLGRREDHDVDAL